jgi:hypothetical protein
MGQGHFSLQETEKSSCPSPELHPDSPPSSWQSPPFPFVIQRRVSRLRCTDLSAPVHILSEYAVTLKVTGYGHGENTEFKTPVKMTVAGQVLLQMIFCPTPWDFPLSTLMIWSLRLNPSSEWLFIDESENRA